MENAVRASIGLTAWRATDNFVPINLMNISAERTVKQSSGSGCRFRRIGIVIWIIIWENRCGLLDALVRAAAIQSAIESICSIRPFILWPMPQIIRLRLWIVVLKQHWIKWIYAKPCTKSHGKSQQFGMPMSLLLTFAHFGASCC